MRGILLDLVQNLLNVGAGLLHDAKLGADFGQDMRLSTTNERTAQRNTL